MIIYSLEDKDNGKIIGSFDNLFDLYKCIDNTLSSEGDWGGVVDYCKAEETDIKTNFGYYKHTLNDTSPTKKYTKASLLDYKRVMRNAKLEDLGV